MSLSGHLDQIQMQPIRGLEKMAKCSSGILLFLNILVHLVLGKQQNPLAPALYVFGDSAVDSGNNNFLHTRAKANYWPYGIDFPAGVTGRFTNGRTFPDFIAESLGLPFAPPFLGLRDGQRNKIITGVNYASGSAGILHESGTAVGRNLYMGKQVKMFRRTVRKYLPKNFKTVEELSKYLSNSIFLVHIGANDYVNNYLVPDHYNSSQLYSPEQFAELLINELGNHLKDLYNLGARKIVVAGMYPLGCALPLLRKLKPKTRCVDEINMLALIFNNKLSAKLQELSSTMNSSRFVYVQSYGFHLDVMANPHTYGLQVTDVPCCVVGANVSTPCISNRKPCSNRKIHLYWDSFHPAEAVMKISAVRCFNGSLLCSPINIQELAQKT